MAYRKHIIQKGEGSEKPQKKSSKKTPIDENKPSEVLPIDGGEIQPPVVEVDLMQTQQTPTNNDVSETQAIVEEETIESEPSAHVEPEPESEKKETESEEDSNGLFLSAEDLAEYAIMLINLGHEGLLPKAYLATNFTREERRKLAAINNGDLTVVTPEVTDLKNRYQTYLEYQKGLPLTVTEQKSLRKNFIRYFKTLNIEMTPGWAMFSSIAMITGMRLIPVAGNVIAKFMEKLFSAND